MTAIASQAAGGAAVPGTARPGGATPAVIAPPLAQPAMPPMAAVTPPPLVRFRRPRPGRSPLAPYLFLSPFLLGFAIFTFYPLAQSVRLSMQQTFGPRATTFVGTRNFKFLLHDPLFWEAVKNTAVFAAGSVFIQLPLSLGLAMLLNRPNLRGRALFRLIFFAPSLVGLVFVAVIGTLAFDKHTGLVDVSLHRLFGFDQDFPWLDNHVMAALILCALWVYVGFNMVYFLAALQNVSRDLIEAALVDGAGPIGRFFNVTLPAIAPVASFVVLLSLVGSFQLFELPWVMLNNTAGPGNQGLTVVMYLYQTGFQSGDLGYASAIGWVLALLLGTLALLNVAMTHRAEADVI